MDERSRGRGGTNARRHSISTGHAILVVDDEVEALTSVRLLLEREGHRVLTAQSGVEALAILERESVQLLLVDYLMPIVNGEEPIARVRQRDNLIQIVFQTSDAREQPSPEMLKRLAVRGYHNKSDGAERLLVWVGVALRAHERLAQLHIAERLKTEMLASVSHEFRVPLKMNPEEIELTPFLRDIAESFDLLRRSSAVAFATDIPDDLPTIWADGAKLRIIVLNLLSNANEFTSEGEIRLGAAVVEPERVAIRVSDSGIGIPAEHYEAIFDMFHHLRPDDGQKTRGVGVGLALARRFAWLMNGDITVDGTVGAGSTFTVVLPFAVAAAASNPLVPGGEVAA